MSTSKISTVLFHQINLQHSRKASLELVNQLKNTENFITFCQEPYHYYGKINGIPYPISVHQPPIQNPRTCILSSNNLNLHSLDSLSDRDTTVCSWETNTPALGQIIIISSYWDITQPNIPTKLIETLSYCKSNNLPVICAIDTNAWSTLWGCDTTNPRGDLMEELVLEENLVILNTGSKPTFRTSRASSIIDLTLISPQLETICRDWRIHNIPSQSDHVAIRFNLTITKPQKILIRPYKKADWPLFDTLLKNWPPPPAFWTQSTIESQCDLFYSKITEALDKACPKQTIKPSIRVSWWTPELEIARKQVHQAHHTACKNRTPSNWATYKAAKRQLWRLTRKAKRESWKEFITNTNTQKTASKLSKIIQSKTSSRTTAYIRQPDGNISQDSKASAITLLNEHFPGNTTQPGPRPDLRPQLITTPTWINPKLIREAFFSFKKDKTAGPDDLKPVVLQNLPPQAIAHLQHIYSACIHLGYTPPIWAASKTVFIPKPGKKDYQDPRSFRPISLTCFLFKTLEKLVLWEANNTCLVTHPMHKNQHAFRSNHSCEVALSKVITKIEKAILNGQYALGVFLDIQGAFDNITHKAIESALIKHNFPPNIVHWYTNYIQNRSCTITFGASKIKRYLNKGAPQGGVFSPIAWNLAFDDLLLAFDLDPTFAIGWADDGCLITTGPDPTTLANLSQKAINTAVQWGKLRGLEFSHNKTSAILFHRKYNNTDQTLTQLQINNKPIPYTKSCTYLGLHLTHNLSWTTHINLKLAAAKRSLLLHRNALGTMWGPQPHIVRWLYEGIIKPALTYGCTIWGAATSSKTFKSKALKLQRLALLPMAPVRTHSPTIGLEVISNLLPLDLFIQKNAIACYDRIKQHLTPWDGIGKGTLRGHTFWLNSLTASLSLPPPCLRDLLPTTQSPAIEMEVQLDDFSKSTPPDPNLSILIFTDGSKTPQGLGAGVAIYQQDSNHKYQPIITRSYKLPDFATVFQAEVEAINQGANIALQMIQDPRSTDLYGNLKDHTFTFISDNKASLLALAKRTVCSKTILNCKTNLKHLSQYTKIKLHWVKAHVGFIGNEHADHLAKKGTTNPTPPPGFPPHPNNQISLPIPKCHLKSLIHNKTISNWNKQWLKNTTCRQTKIFFPETNPNKSNALLKLDREDFGRLSRWLTGHCFLNRHNHLLDPINHPSPLCNLCGMESETPAHIICDCEAISKIRYHHFQEHFLDKLNPIWRSNSLITFILNPQIANLEQTPQTQ